MKKRTKKEACWEWVNRFNAIPTEMIQELMDNRPDDWEDITPICVGDAVFLNTRPEESTTCEGEVQKLEADKLLIKMDDGCIVEAMPEDIAFRQDEGMLPAWSTMWSFGSSMDDSWLEQEENMQKMANCGFTIFRSEKYGLFFGINGGGYDFYEDHWLPLYDARGMHWHTEEDSKDYYQEKIK